MLRDIQAWFAQRLIRKRIKTIGWIGTYVPNGNRGFAYTTGFQESVGAPEIIMFGVNETEATHLAREIYSDLKSGALVLKDQERWPPEESPKIALREVHPSQIRREYLNVAIWRRTDLKLDPASLRVFQLVWPDTANVYPWEPGYDVDYVPRQLALYLPFEDDPAND